MKIKIVIILALICIHNGFGYIVSIQNLLDVQVRVTTEYQNPQLCPPFTFDVPSNSTIEQRYIDDCCFTKLTVSGKNKTYFQFGTGACENYNYIIRPKIANQDFYIDRESSKIYEKPS
jgi:hypothetical protein